jgi:hypothetical protein
MACTDAVETEIDRHYGEQLSSLATSDPELAADIRQFQAEELEHRDTRASMARPAPPTTKWWSARAGRKGALSPARGAAPDRPAAAQPELGDPVQGAGDGRPDRPGTCSGVGPGGDVGCALKDIQQGVAERASRTNGAE